MYKDFFGLNENPFNLTPDPDFLFLSKEHKKAMAYLTYGLESKKGIVQLTGEIGSGKTTILRSIIQKNKNKIKCAYILNPKATFEQLFRTILNQFSVIDLDSVDTIDVLFAKFEKYLYEQLKLQFPVLIVIDEAQNIELPVLEEIRMLSNFETEKEKLVQIVFVGQPELREIFALQKFKQLKQRISVACHLTALRQPDISEYIRHRLNVAGADNPEIFTPEACNELYAYTNGIPRLINVVCDAAMLAGYVEERKVLDKHIVRNVIEGLNEA